MSKNKEKEQKEQDYYLVPENLIVAIYNYLNTKPRQEVNNIANAIEQLKKTTK